MESWLVGGSAATGAADIVLLVESRAPSRRRCSSRSSERRARRSRRAAPTSSCRPGTQLVVPLAGLVLGEESPVIRVTAIGRAGARRRCRRASPAPCSPGGVDQVGAIAVAGAAAGRSPASRSRRTRARTARRTRRPSLRMLSPTADTTATITATPIGARSRRARADDRPARGRACRPRSSSAACRSGQYTVEVVGRAPRSSPPCGRRPASARALTSPGTPPRRRSSAPSLFAAPPGPPPVAHAREPRRRAGRRVASTPSTARSTAR